MFSMILETENEQTLEFARVMCESIVLRDGLRNVKTVYAIKSGGKATERSGNARETAKRKNGWHDVSEEIPDGQYNVLCYDGLEVFMGYRNVDGIWYANLHRSSGKLGGAVDVVRWMDIR